MKSEKIDEKNIYTVEINDIKLLEKDEKISIIDGTHFKLIIEKENVPEFIEMLINKNVKIYEIKEERVSLEEAFLKKTGGNIIG